MKQQFSEEYKPKPHCTSIQPEECISYAFIGGMSMKIYTSGEIIVKRHTLRKLYIEIFTLGEIVQLPMYIFVGNFVLF